MKNTHLALSIALAVLLILSAIFTFAYRSPNDEYAGLGLDLKCKGSAKCFYGTVEQVVDGDTFVINGETVRLALVNTEEKNELNYETAKDFVNGICPVGSTALVDEDDSQASRSHRRIVAVVYCGLENVNEALLSSGYAKILEDFCRLSEFSSEPWVKAYGCDPG